MTDIVNHLTTYMEDWLSQEDVYAREAWNEVSEAVLDAITPPSGLLVNDLFVARMEKELQANIHQGDWNTWLPSPGLGVNEIEHHLEKLKTALVSGNPEQVSEYAADIANISMRISDVHGVTAPVNKEHTN